MKKVFPKSLCTHRNPLHPPRILATTCGVGGVGGVARNPLTVNSISLKREPPSLHLLRKICSSLLHLPASSSILHLWQTLHLQFMHHSRSWKKLFSRGWVILPILRSFHHVQGSLFAPSWNHFLTTGGGELRQRLAEALPGSSQQRRGTVQVLSRRLGMLKTSCTTECVL